MNSVKATIEPVKRLSVSVRQPQSMNVGFNGVVIGGKIQGEKAAIPSREEQIITADMGYSGIAKVIIEAIPRNYGLITYNGFELTIT